MWLRFRKRAQLVAILSFCGLALVYKFSGGSEEVPSSQSSPNVKHPIRDVHVVIGYYQGNSLPWLNSENLTEELLNANMFSPDYSSGADGQPVLLPSFHSAKSQKLFQINRFNLLASDRIALNRTLPDVRRKECQTKSYPKISLTTSVIIVFHNEAWSTLLRTVHSVINRSPVHLLEEILLVDDASDRDFLKKPLEEHVGKLKNVRVIRSEKRGGLIKARLQGAAEATGDVLTFLDAHCECTQGWLEPLLNRIEEDNTVVVAPVIDILNDESFQYVRSFELHQGGFNWELHFRWFSLPAEVIRERRTRGDGVGGFKTPVIAGGLFSIHKEFFNKLGTYDPQMSIWGGENIEFSLRTWTCGGSLEILPCSHVGHLFRKSSPYSFPNGVGNTLNSNLARVALVWLDEWKEFYFKLHPEVAIYAKNQSVEERVELRKRLKCKSFKWFLENVWPHHFFPMEDQFFGRIRNYKSGKCLQTPSSKSFGQPYGTAGVSDCVVEIYGPQLFGHTADGYLKTDDSVCVDGIEYKGEETQVRIMACSTLERQQWIAVPHKGQQLLKQRSSGKCLDLGKVGLILKECLGVPSQLWSLEQVQWK